MMCLRRMQWVRPWPLRNQAETKLPFLSTIRSSSSTIVHDSNSSSSEEEVDGVELSALVGNPPSFTGADVDPALAQKLDLCASEGFDHLHMKKLQSPRHHFCKYPYSRLVSIIAVLKHRHISGKQAALILSCSPMIFTYRPQLLDKKIAFLEDLGLQTPHIIKMLCRTSFSFILGLAVQNMQNHVDLLHDFGINKESIPKVISDYPNFLFLSIDNKIKPTLEFLANKGLTKESLSKLLLLRPNVLGISLDPGLSQRLILIQHMGLDINSNHGLRALACWCTLSITRTLANLEFLKSQGFSHDDACQIARKQPTILQLKQESVQQSLDYLKNVLNRDIQEVVKFPGYLAHSLKARIAPRFTLLNNCNLALSYVLSLSNQEFDKRFGKESEKKRKSSCKDGGPGPADASVQAA